MAVFLAATALAMGGDSANLQSGGQPAVGGAATAESGGAGSGGPAGSEGSSGTQYAIGGGATAEPPQASPAPGVDANETTEAGDHDHDDSDGFVPNGENGLMLLADYVAGQGKTGGDVPGAGQGPTGLDPVDGQPGLPDSFQVATNDTSGGGFGFGFGSGGSGGGAGGGGGGGGGGPGSEPTPDGGPPFVEPPVITITPGGDGPDGGPDPMCLLADGCDLTPPTFEPPPTFQPPGEGDPPMDFPPPGDFGGGAGPIPEPATWLMLLMGFMGLGGALRAQRRRAAVA